MEINQTYFDINNINNLSDETYMKKIEEVFRTNKIPHFLLREGFRLRKYIKNNIELLKKNNNNEIDESDKDDYQCNNCSEIDGINVENKNNIKFEKEK